MPGFPPEWPPACTSYLQLTFGEPGRIENLAGLSDAPVYRIDFPESATSVVIKIGQLTREYRFYTEFAPALRLQGIGIPILYRAERTAELGWLVLENIPLALPRDRWQADPAVLRLLKKLHQAKIPAIQNPEQFYQPAWPDGLTTACLEWFPVELAGKLGPLLENWRRNCQELFQPECPLSGDPNMLNWGTYEDGRVVLFDWERFCMGTPALDLGILVPGMLGYDIFERFARAYLNLDQPPEAFEVEVFARQMLAAKIWSLVEFIARYASGLARLKENVEWLLTVFPTWLQSLPAPAA